MQAQAYDQHYFQIFQRSALADLDQCTGGVEDLPLLTHPTDLNLSKDKSMITKNVPIKTTSRYFMSVNVILTFKTYDDFEDPQEMFDVKLPVSRHEKNAIDFLNKTLFPRITSECRKRQRAPRQLVKISTYSAWGVFEEATLKPALSSSDHPCKWYFGTGRDDLDGWEIALMREHEFGVDADMSFLNSIRKMHENVSPSAALV
jgi:hypothetical protein